MTFKVAGSFTLVRLTQLRNALSPMDERPPLNVMVFSAWQSSKAEAPNFWRVAGRVRVSREVQP